MRIVFLDRETFPPEAKFPPLSFDCDWQEYSYTDDKDTAARIVDADIVVANKVELRADNLKEARRLKLIALTATGSNNVDLDYCTNNNIIVSNIRNYSSQSVVEHALSLIFALNRNLFAYKKIISDGNWQKSRQFVIFATPISDLKDATIGIIGRGDLGQTLAKYCSSLGMKPIFAERPNATSIRPGYEEFYEVLKVSDIVSMHCPLTPETKEMMGKKEFMTMKDSAFFINTARGGLVNEAELATALRNGVIAAAGLDVLSVEPPPADNPLLALADQPNLIITPHTAWISQQALESGIKQTIENIENFVAGNPSRVLT